MVSKPLTWIEVDKNAFEHNISQYKKLVGPTTQLAPVIKSNAYGHGAEIIARWCDQNSYVNYICVVSLQEAIALRKFGITKPILVLTIIDAALEHAVSLDIDLVAYDKKIINELNRIGKDLIKKGRIHIKVDTGLSRAGLLPSEVYSLITHAIQFPFIAIQGLCTHFAESESDNPTFTHNQLQRFDTLLQQLDHAGIHIPYKHTSCSAAVTAFKQAHYNFTRVGIGIYGLWPSAENKKITQTMHPDFKLSPVLSWKTTIIQIKKIPSNSYIGYDRTYQTGAESTIALLPIGYWDGYDRQLSNQSKVIIHGKQAHIRGRIAMNVCMVDINHIPEAAVGDEVILLGESPGVTADELAAMCHTINYEIVTRINPLLPRKEK